LPLRQKSQITLPDHSVDKIILYQGRLNVGRGIETTILAMHQIEGAKLWLAGEGDLSQSLRDLVKAEGLEDKVNFLGYLTPEALQMVTLEAYIGLNLLENQGLNYYYSLANKAFDYIQVGLPSVQMDFPEYRALQEQYGGFSLLAELEVSSLVGALQQLIHDLDYWLQLHQNCLAARKELSWEEEEKTLAHFYASIVDKVDNF
jgi:glycosyltransferase involved in cell wall biosynthesis